MRKTTFNKFLTMIERSAINNIVYVTRQDKGETILYYICNGIICLRVGKNTYKNYIEDKKPYLIGLQNNSTVSSAGGGTALADMIDLEKYFDDPRINHETKYTKYKRQENGEARTKMIYSDGKHLTYIDEDFLSPCEEFLHTKTGRTGERSIDPIIFDGIVGDAVALFTLPVRSPDWGDIDQVLLKMGA